MNVINQINAGDGYDSKWYLERKARDEFGNKQTIEHSGEMTTKQEIKHDLSKLSIEELKVFQTLLDKTGANNEG